MLEDVLDDVLQELLGERHVAGEIAERHLRLDHPELGEVAGRVGVLGAKRGAERVDVAEREREDLAFELPAHRQVGGLAEEVARRSRRRHLRVARQIRQIERGDAEHLARAFAVGGGDDRGVDVEEAALAGRTGEWRTTSALRTRKTAPNVFERVRRWAISREKLHGVPLFLQGVRWPDRRLRKRGSRAALSSTACPAPARRDELSRDPHAGAGRDVAQRLVGYRRLRRSTTCRSVNVLPSLTCKKCTPLLSRRVLTQP